MSSSRKRIGFLPKIEIQELINQISSKSNSSQSRITGILVEEALISRGLLNPIKDNIERKADRKAKQELDSLDLDNSFIEDIRINNNSKLHKAKNDNDIIQSSLEYELLKDYMAFKRYKMMLKKLKNEGI